MTSDNDESFDNGFSEYTYSFPAAFGELNDVESDGCSIASNGTCDGLYTTTRVHNFFMNGDSRELARLEYYPESALSFLSPPNPIYEWNRGLLLTKTLYDKNFNKVQEEIYSYKLYFPSGETAPKKVYGLKISQFDPFTSFANDPLGGTVARNFAFRVAKYELLTDVAKVPSITTVRYYGNSSSEFRSHTTTQEYGGHKHMNPTRITKTSSNGNTLLTTISYPFDYGLNGPVAPGAGVYSLRIKNISSTPVETSNYIVDHGVQYLKNSTLTLYDLSNSRPVLVKVLSLETDKLLTDFVPSYIDFSGLFRIDNRYTERLYFGRYDDRGNPLQIEDKRSGITTSYVWGYDKQLIIAKVVNATYDAVEAQVGTTYISHIGKGYYTIPSGAGVGYQTVLPSQIKEWLTPVRVNLPGCFLNIGTYDNLFRVESQIDPNGRTSYFGYDGMNRLKVTKDHDGNVINMFDYHFRKVN